MLCDCGFKYTPLWIQGLKRLVLWTQNLTLLEGQGLWIQSIVLHCSCAKAASERYLKREGESSGFLLYDASGQALTSFNIGKAASERYLKREGESSGFLLYDASGQALTSFNIGRH